MIPVSQVFCCYHKISVLVSSTTSHLHASISTFTQWYISNSSSYSVGTRRPCIIEPGLIERCRAILNIDGVEPSNHDQRMVAEILLYSKLYTLLQLQGAGDSSELHTWREQWDYLFRTFPPDPFSRTRPSMLVSQTMLVRWGFAFYISLSLTGFRTRRPSVHRNRVLLRTPNAPRPGPQTPRRGQKSH